MSVRCNLELLTELPRGLFIPKDRQEPMSDGDGGPPGSPFLQPSGHGRPRRKMTPGSGEERSFPFLENDELDDALARAFAHSGPSLVEIVADPLLV